MVPTTAASTMVAKPLSEYNNVSLTAASEAPRSVRFVYAASTPEIEYWSTGMLVPGLPADLRHYGLVFQTFLNQKLPHSISLKPTTTSKSCLRFRVSVFLRPVADRVGNTRVLMVRGFPIYAYLVVQVNPTHATHHLCPCPRPCSSSTRRVPRHPEP